MMTIWITTTKRSGNTTKGQLRVESIAVPRAMIIAMQMAQRIWTRFTLDLFREGLDRKALDLTLLSVRVEEMIVDVLSGKRRDLECQSASRFGALCYPDCFRWEHPMNNLAWGCQLRERYRNIWDQGWIMKKPSPFVRLGRFVENTALAAPGASETTAPSAAHPDTFRKASGMGLTGEPKTFSNS